MNGQLTRRALLDELFVAIDAMDTKTFLAKLSPRAEFRFGAAPPVRSKALIGEAVGAFFSSIAGLRHELTNIVADGDLIVCEGFVTYTRHDDSTIALPFANFFEFDGDLIVGYRIYIDIGPLYAASP